MAKDSRYRKEAPPALTNGPSGFTNRGTNPGLVEKTGSPVTDIPGGNYGGRDGVSFHPKAMDGVDAQTMASAKAAVVMERKPINDGTTAGLPAGSRGKFPIANPPSIHD